MVGSLSFLLVDVVEKSFFIDEPVEGNAEIGMFKNIVLQQRKGMLCLTPPARNHTFFPVGCGILNSPKSCSNTIARRGVRPLSKGAFSVAFTKIVSEMGSTKQMMKLLTTFQHQKILKILVKVQKIFFHSLFANMISITIWCISRAAFQDSADF